MKGLFEVTTKSSGGHVFARRGPGEILGELSFIDREPTSASVIAQEKCQVLTVSWDVLNERMQADARFAADFYRALSQVNAQRLRSTMGQFGDLRREESKSKIADTPLYSELANLIARFKEKVTEADADAIENKGVV